MGELYEAIERLNATDCGWRIERISPTTYVKDLRLPERLNPIEASNLQYRIRTGKVFGCKIGRHERRIGYTIIEAVDTALQAFKEKTRDQPANHFRT